MALPIIPTDINGSNRFNQFDPSIAGLILKTSSNDRITDYRDPRNESLTRCERYIGYMNVYPYDFECPSASYISQFSPNSTEDKLLYKNIIIGKLTGYWMFTDKGKSFEVELFNPVWGRKGQSIRYFDYLVPTGVNMMDNYAHVLLKDDGTVTGVVYADTATRTGSRAVPDTFVSTDKNLFPHFDADYPVTDVEKWDKYFQFNRAAWVASVYPQVGTAGGYTDLWIFQGYDFKVPIVENDFGLMGGAFASYNIPVKDVYPGRFDDNGIELNSTTNLLFTGNSKWLGGYVKSHGFVLSSSDPNPEKAKAGCVFVEKSKNNLCEYFASHFLFQNLTANTTYYYRQYYIIYDQNGDETIVYQAVKTVTTLSQVLETIVTYSTPRIITSNSVSYNLLIAYIGTKSIKEIGIVVGKTQDPVPNAVGTIKATTDSRYVFTDWAERAPQPDIDYSVININGLLPATLYYARTYVIYSDDSIYYPNCDVNAVPFSNDYYLNHPEAVNQWKQFTTYKAAQTVPKIVLNCTFGESQLSDSNGRTYLSARITDTGGSVVTARGVCFNTTGNPKADGSNGSTVVIINEQEERRDIDATFYPTVTGLKANTKYFFRAFATNATGTGYSDGSTELATTIAPVINDFIHTKQPGTLKSTSAVSGGIIQNDGGSQITAKGVVWSLTQNPTIALSTKTSEAITGNGLGIFDSVLTNLLPGRNYYVKAYYTNGTETKYGEEYSFRTADLITAPVISLLDAVVKTTGITLGMNTTDDGGAAVVNKLVWAEKTSSTFILPDTLPTSGHVITLTAGEVLNNTVEIPIGSFTAGKTYVFKAYADNGQLKSFSAQKQFSIAAAQVAPVAGACTLISKTNLSLSVRTVVSALNNNTIVEHGILLNDGAINNENNWIQNNSFGTSASGVASFIELTPATTYYVRSYLTYTTPEGQTTILGAQSSFTTEAEGGEDPAVPTLELTKSSLVNNLGIFQIAVSGVTGERGIVFSTLPGPTIFNATAVSAKNGIATVSFPDIKQYYVRGYVVKEIIGTVYYSNQIMVTIDNVISVSGIPLNPALGQLYSKGIRNWKFNGEGWQKI